MTIHYRCLNCPETGTTTGTESGADAKHMRATGHAIVTSTQPARAGEAGMRGCV